MADSRTLVLVCPDCGTFGSPSIFASDDDNKAYAALLVDVPPEIGRRLLRYLGLFNPPQRRMTAPRAYKLLAELVPAVVAQRVARKGRSWAAPHAAWVACIDDMLERRDKLELPLTTHGYLYELLAAAANRVEAIQEAEIEARRRQGRGAPTALDAAPGGQTGTSSETQEQFARRKRAEDAARMSTSALRRVE